MPEQITLYASKSCPYAQRTEIALAEAGAEFTRYEIDLMQNMPEWYAPKVNPANKVPAVAYGGPKVPADQPSPESVKITESLVLLEFFTDLFPEARLLPKDPVQRARARFFMDAVGTKFTPGFSNLMQRGEDAEAFLKGAEALQALLPDDKTFAIGDDFTIADAAFAPFLARAVVSLKNDIGAFAPGEGKKAYEVLAGPRFAKLNKYYSAIQARESFKTTFDEEFVKDVFQKHFAKLRAQRLAS